MNGNPGEAAVQRALRTLTAPQAAEAAAWYARQGQYRTASVLCQLAGALDAAEPTPVSSPAALIEDTVLVPFAAVRHRDEHPRMRNTLQPDGTWTTAPAPEIPQIRTPEEIRDVPGDQRTRDELYRYGTDGPWPGRQLPEFDRNGCPVARPAAVSHAPTACAYVIRAAADEGREDVIRCGELIRWVTEKVDVRTSSDPGPVLVDGRSKWVHVNDRHLGGSSHPATPGD